MSSRLPYRPPKLESLGSIEKLTQTDTTPTNATDGNGYGPFTPPPGS
jgi:hypothetical protein